jgi:hypothetical protein
MSTLSKPLSEGFQSDLISVFWMTNSLQRIGLFKHPLILNPVRLPPVLLAGEEISPLPFAGLRIGVF